MYVKLSKDETNQNFNVWVHGERDKLVRGSGLFVGETGVTANHHFLAPDGNAFRFSEGRYKLDVYAHLLGDSKPLPLFSQALDVSREMAAEMEKKNAGLYFDWGPDSGCYLPHVDRRPPTLKRIDFSQLFEDEGLQE